MSTGRPKGLKTYQDLKGYRCKLFPLSEVQTESVQEVQTYNCKDGAKQRTVRVQSKVEQTHAEVSRVSLRRLFSRQWFRVGASHF
jgi:hypothetical protein